MDLAIAGRTAFLSGLTPSIDASCRRTLEGEGVRLVGDLTDEVDIVVTQWSGVPGNDILDVATAGELYEAWGRVVDTIDNYLAIFPAMEERGWGRLVWIGSASAKSLDAQDDDLGAVISMAMMAAHKVITHELAPSGVTANAVLGGRAATDDDIAAAVAFLCSQGAAYLTGVTLTVDGGAGSAVF